MYKKSSGDGVYKQLDPVELSSKQKLYDWTYLTCSAACIYTIAWYNRSFSLDNSANDNFINGVINIFIYNILVSMRDSFVAVKLLAAQPETDQGLRIAKSGDDKVQVGATCSLLPRLFLAMFLYNVITPAVFVVAVPYFSQRYFLPHLIPDEAKPIVGCAFNIALALLLWSVKVAVFHYTGLDKKLKFLNQLQPMSGCDKVQEVLFAWVLNAVTLGITNYIAGGLDMSDGVACSVGFYQLYSLFKIVRDNCCLEKPQRMSCPS